MGDLFWNKVFGALLAVALGVMGLRVLSETVFAAGHGEGGHHGEEEVSLNDWAHSRFAYYTDIAETAGPGGAEEEIYDLGALLAEADATAGERSFQAKCTTCHTIEQGGQNGTGPNLYGIVGASHAHMDSFGYSAAMQATSSQDWTYESMDQWLENPSGYISGTSMAFAGLRRDDERANVIAYLASMSPNAPDFPEPLPEEESDIVEGDEAVATDLDAETVEDSPTEATGEIDTVDMIDDTDQEEENEGEVVLAPSDALDADEPSETDE
ncbi:MAG: cytochrome c family protein [Henriciella sp.]|uniref:c-type cytochrome n=1 Tax=Henriciella sp. TaxID=1968823 RepID=UPI003C78E94A